MGGGFVCVLLGGPTYRIVDAHGREWSFEDHRYCGPSALNRRTGEPLLNQPPAHSPFWEAVTLWAQQGRRAENGVAFWERPRAGAAPEGAPR
ncbi:MAG TPA: hypothetical protein VEA38_00810 [Terriglobales bacterium]|nr:hypothetical protein [Terriglobales bacterium]